MPHHVTLDVSYPSRGGRRTVAVTFHAASVAIAWDADTVLELDYTHAQTGLGGAHDNQPMLTLVGPDAEAVRLYFPDQACFRAAAACWPAPLAQAAQRQGRKTWRNRALLGGLAGLLAAGWFARGLMLDGLVALVPTSVEPKLGRAVTASMLRGKEVSNPVLVQAVSQMGQALVKQTPGAQVYTFRFHVVRENFENAFAAPGGEVVVTTPLLARAESADELACILGHEIQHVVRRHSTRAMVRQLGVTTGFMLVFGDAAGAAATIASMGLQLSGLAFDRDQERESDRVGLRCAHAAGYDPLAITRFFKRVDRQRDEMDDALSFLSTHPAPAERIQTIAQLAKQLGPVPRGVKRPQVDWKQVQRAARNP